MERLQLFHVFSSTPFSVALLVLAVSILICTLDRTPRLWQQSAAIRVVQPDAYFDPRLPDRVSIAAGPGLTAAAVAAALRRAPVRRPRGRRPTTARASCTATATAGRSWRRSSPTSG